MASSNAPAAVGGRRTVSLGDWRHSAPEAAVFFRGRMRLAVALVEGMSAETVALGLRLTDATGVAAFEADFQLVAAAAIFGVIFALGITAGLFFFCGVSGDFLDRPDFGSMTFLDGIVTNTSFNPNAAHIRDRASSVSIFA